MSHITSIYGRILYNSRGSKTIEIEITSSGKTGRVCAPSGASVGKYEAASFPVGGPEESVKIVRDNASKFVGLELDLKTIHDTIHEIDHTPNYSKIGGATAFAITIACVETISMIKEEPLYKILSKNEPKFPYPLGNILGGGGHAGPGTPDIQEILVCAIGAKTIHKAIETNLAVHKELRKILEIQDQKFTSGRGDEGGWAPKLDNHQALELAAKACEDLGFTLGKEVALGVDFASSTQWDGQKYRYSRGGFENSTSQQIDYTSDIIKKYKLIYAEDAVHEEAFDDMAELTRKFPDVMITGDDLTVTNKTILNNAIKSKSCNAAILKVNQAGSLFDALEFADLANNNNIKLVTSHRSGESTDSHISHIGIATNSKMLKIGVVGGERIAKINELIRLSEHNLICEMARV